jgi:peptidoglycan L-alanyl-D-glutamate endopeptidase CwlK
MSAGAGDGGPTVSRDLALLAPVFRAAVERAIADCQARQLDAYVYEAYRSPELQALYYARGRTIVPPTKPVTNAPTNLQSWHGYGLAVDVISKSKAWDQPEEWFARVAESFAKFGCRWGGEWKQRDLPHFQWGRCQPSPSDSARVLIAAGGLPAVWDAAGAVMVA